VCNLASGEHPPYRDLGDSQSAGRFRNAKLLQVSAHRFLHAEAKNRKARRKIKRAFIQEARSLRLRRAVRLDRNDPYSVFQQIRFQVPRDDLKDRTVDAILM